MAVGEGSLIDGLIVLFLKISPILFSMSLGLVRPSFYQQWQKGWNCFSGSENITGDWAEHSWKFHNISVYVHDKAAVSSSGQVSLVFLVLLHLLLVYQEGTTVLVLPAAVFLLFALALPRVVERVFQMNPERRNPTRYEKYYYDSEADLSDSDVQSFKRRRVPLWLDRRLSPPRVIVLVDFLIVFNIGILEGILRIFPEVIRGLSIPLGLGVISMLVSLGFAGLMSLIAFLLFPFD